MKQKQRELLGSLMLFTAAFLWGLSFAFQSNGIRSIGPFTYSTIRYLLGGTVLLPVIPLSKKLQHENQLYMPEDILRRDQTGIVGGVICGFLLFAASGFQQFGLLTAEAGKAGFITALYIIGVPLLGVLTHRRTSGRLWFCVLLAAAGMYLLCVSGGRFTIQTEDLWLLACALAFSFHIITVDHFSPRADGVLISSVQFFTAGLLSVLPMIFRDRPAMDAILDNLGNIAYGGIVSCGIAYTLQVVFQKDVPPTKASLLMSFESVFSVLGGWLILHSVLSLRELAGCAVMFAAIILAQL